MVISPDYASHLLPLATLASPWRRAGERVVVATGPATEAIVHSFGYEWMELPLGRGSNPGVIRAEQQPPGEDDALRGFFAATRQGMVETLAYQARARSSDLMWEPVRCARAVQRACAAVAPDTVLVDHLAFSARLGLAAAGVPYADAVLGHPSALPAPGEIYGYPTAWPRAFSPDPRALEELRELCAGVAAAFTATWNDALRQLAPGADASPDAFAEHGDIVLYNYPAELAVPGRAVPPRHVFLGSAVRDEPHDALVADWLAASDEPFVYVSLGSFLSVREDVQARVIRALAELGIRAAIATGSADPRQLGRIPATWLVAEFLPQVRLLSRAAAAVTHGGNNSVTEAMTFGVPLLVLPLSTDQFAAAQAIEARGVGEALAPNTATTRDLRDSLHRLLHLPHAQRRTLDALSSSLRAWPGPRRALAALHPMSLTR